ncbi:synaptotagmin-15 [Amia ocellicauda]|uniref:synaptotagmin-15 n=1 Tax=Amia ocellicauda TaxID=2972642 RepID=UPI003464E7A9
MGPPRDCVMKSLVGWTQCALSEFLVQARGEEKTGWVGYSLAPLMAVPVVAVASGLASGILLLVLLGIVAYFLWKRKCFWGHYEELVTPTPSVQSGCPAKSPPSQSSNHSSDGIIPFVVPPRFNFNPRSSLEGEDDEGFPTAPQSHRGSFTAMGTLGWERGHGVTVQLQLGPLVRSVSALCTSAPDSFPLGSLRADLYCPPSEPCEWAPPQGGSAQLWFSVEYRREREQLLVLLLRAANLPRPSQAWPTLVKLHLLPDSRRHLQARARGKGRSPQFNHNFVFQVSSKCVLQCTLRFSLFSVDRLRKHQQLGQVLFPLREPGLSEAAGRVLWRDLETHGAEVQHTDPGPLDTNTLTPTPVQILNSNYRDISTLHAPLSFPLNPRLTHLSPCACLSVPQPCSACGEVQVSLNYNQSLQRLTVVVLRARGLQLLPDRGGLGVESVFVQASLQVHTRLVKSKRTAAVRGESCPTFNETLTFKLPSSQLDGACLSLELRQSEPEQHRSLGLVVIGPFMFARGQELEHWNDMVSKPQELVKQWHLLSSVAETPSPS